MERGQRKADATAIKSLPHQNVCYNLWNVAVVQPARKHWNICPVGIHKTNSGGEEDICATTQFQYAEYDEEKEQH